jgi:hypothetical protein
MHYDSAVCCGEAVENGNFSVKRRGKQRVRKVEPKVLVEKQVFDKVLGKLIQTKPKPRNTPR